MARQYPRLVIAGLSGDAGKTITSLSLLTALKRRGLSLSVFKKGPDYIDAAWLSWASGADCRNLDTFMVDPRDVAASFGAVAGGSDLAVIEGNRGLLDGRDTAGTHSTASLARLLKAPVVLVVNCTKVTRTVAALVKGCQVLEPDLNLVGVILNRVGGARHRRVVTEAIERECGVPVLGAIPKLRDGDTLIPGRHLGLVTPSEFGSASVLEDRLAEIAEEYLEVERLIELAKAAEELAAAKRPKPIPSTKKVRIGCFRDSVFTFYYPENLQALEDNGAEVIEIDSLKDDSLPELDGLYIGGGFPETQAEKLARNRSLMQSVKRAADNGLPIYAECGGLIYLCRSLTCDGRKFDMGGLFELDLKMHVKPVGHGYTEVTVDRDNPFFQIGTTIRGHEFHYTGPTAPPSASEACLRVDTGVGLGNQRDGLIYNNCLACYTHLHADGHPLWAVAMVERAKEYRAKADRPEMLKESRGKDSTLMEVLSRPGVKAGALAAGG